MDTKNDGALTMKNSPKKTRQVAPDQTKFDGYKQQFEQLYRSANRWTHGWISVFIRALNRFNLNHANESAAGIAFFSIFSIVPLLVFVMSAVSPLITSSVVRTSIENFLTNAFPVSLARLMDIIYPLVTSNETLDLIALLGFLWAASNMFNFILHSVNRSWNSQSSRGFVKNRLLALAFVTGMAVLVVLLFILLFFMRLIAGFLPGIGNYVLTLILPLLIQILLIFLIYTFGPATTVNKRATLIAAILATIAMEIITRGFSWYLNSGWSTFPTFYGPLAALIGLLFWVFLSYWTLLFGAYLSEAIHQRWNSDNASEFFEPLEFSIPRFGF